MSLYTLIVAAVLLVTSSSLEHKDQCTTVSRTYTELGYPTIDVPRRAKYGESVNHISIV